MRNIYSRSKFKKINEEIKDVANVSNSPSEIAKAWNVSLVGAITNGVVGGTIKALTAIYKWGRRGWYRKNLLSKLNKEYLKALIFFADRKNINLETGEIFEEKKEEITDNQTDDIVDVDKLTQREVELKDLAKKLEQLKTLEDMQLDETVKEFYEYFKILDKKLEKNRIYFDNYSDALENAKKNKNIENIKYYEDLLKKVKKSNEGLKVTKKENDKSKKLLDKKLLELGGTPKDLTAERIKVLKKEIFHDNIEKMLPEGWESKNEFTLDNVPNFIDYPTFKELRQRTIPDPKKVKVGDKFTYYTTKKGEKTSAVVREEKQQIKKGNIPVTIGKIQTSISKDRALPDDFPDFKQLLSFMEKNLFPYVRKYDKMSSKDKQKFLEIVQTYKVLNKEYELLKPNITKAPKSEKVELQTDSVTNENGEQLFELQVSKKLTTKPSSGLEGGDLVKGDKKLDIFDVLSNTEIQKLKSSGITNLAVLDINYGAISNTIEEKFSKQDVSKLVNKYNLEVIKLVADKVFETEKQKKNWSVNVNKVNAFWNDILNVDDVNILHGLSFNGKVKGSSLDKNISEMSSVYNLSALKDVLLDDKKVIINNISDGLYLVLLFNYNNLSYIMTSKGTGVNLQNKKVIRLATLLESKEKDGKEIFFSNQNKLQELFVRNNGDITVNGERKTSLIKDEVETYFIFKYDQNSPTEITNKPISASVIVMNFMTIREDNGTKPIVCVFDDKTKDNINIFSDSLKKVPEIKIKLQYIASVKGDIEQKMKEETKLDTLRSNGLDNSTQKIQQRINDIQQKNKK